MISSMNFRTKSPRSGSNTKRERSIAMSDSAIIKDSIETSFQNCVRGEHRPKNSAHSSLIPGPVFRRTQSRPTLRKSSVTFAQVHPYRWPLMPTGAPDAARTSVRPAAPRSAQPPRQTTCRGVNIKRCGKRARPQEIRAWLRWFCPIKTSADYQPLNGWSTKKAVKNHITCDAYGTYET